MATNRKKKISPKRIIFLLGCICISLGIIYLLAMQVLFKRAAFISPIPTTLANAIQTFTLDDDATLLKKELAKKSIVPTSFVKYKDSTMILTLETGEEVLLSSEKDIVSQVGSLHLILTRLKIEGKAISRLDLRFEKPVAVFK